uniref:Putative secreted protein n=1 Tax=Ixodes scapularis TaxID=6945 RepID=A0A4D5RYM0_IXOSC
MRRTCSGALTCALCTSTATRLPSSWLALLDFWWCFFMLARVLSSTRSTRNLSPQNGSSEDGCAMAHRFPRPKLQNRPNPDRRFFII